jgi:hypothetical protein
VEPYKALTGPSNKIVSALAITKPMFHIAFLNISARLYRNGTVDLGQC